MTPDDFELMAYVDGELDAAASKRIAEAINADPVLQDKVDKLIESRTIAKAAYAPAEEPELSPGLESLIDGIRDDLAKPEKELPGAMAGSGGGGALTWVQGRWATITATGFAAGALAVWGMMTMVQPDPLLTLAGDGSAVLSTRAQTVLSTSPSGQRAGEMVIQTSFISDNGAPCRQFELADQAGIACRAEAGWQLIVLADIASNDRYQAAGNTDPVAVAAAALGVSDVLSNAAEAALIEANWQPPLD